MALTWASNAVGFSSGGAVEASTGALQVPLPASIQTDDILVIFQARALASAGFSDQASGTWTEVTDSPINVGSGTTYAGLSMFWSRYNGTQTAPTLAAVSNHQLAVMLALRGLPTSGDPFDVTSSDSADGDNTTVAITGDTTTVEGCLVITCVATDDDAQTWGATWADGAGNLANLARRLDTQTSLGNDSRMAVISGEAASASTTYGTINNTMTAAGNKVGITVAFKPAGAATITGSAAIALDGALTAAGLQETLASAGIALSVGVTAAGDRVALITTGASGITLGGSLTGAGLVEVLASAGVALDSGVTAASLVEVLSQASVALDSSLTAASLVEVLGSAAINGGLAIVVAGDVATAGVITGSAAIALGSQLVGEALLEIPGVVAITLDSDLTAAGIVEVLGAAGINLSVGATTDALVEILAAASLTPGLGLTASGGTPVVIVTGEAAINLALEIVSTRMLVKHGQSWGWATRGLPGRSYG